MYVIDFETTGLEYYRPDFRIESMAASWRDGSGEIQSRFFVGEPEVRKFLLFTVGQSPLVVHNAQFEMGVMLNRLKGYKFNIYCDTMRLAQVTIGRGDGVDAGLGLEKCIKRVLHPKYHDHKAKFYDWLVEHKGCKRKDAGQFLSELPPEMLREYNILDTELTLRLYERLAAYAEEIGYDWRLDSQLYLNTCLLLAKSKSRGVPVDREGLNACVAKKDEELAEMERRFRNIYSAEISSIESEKAEAWVNALKSEKGREKRREVLKSPGGRALAGVEFNVSSAKDKERLFVDKLGLEVKFRTPKGGPSFKASHMVSYGDGGALLSKKGSIQLVKTQAESLLGLSEYDGRYHPDLKPTGTNTGRLSAGRED